MSGQLYKIGNITINIIIIIATNIEKVALKKTD